MLFGIGLKKADLTGLRLAKQTGFKQAHISNFLIVAWPQS